MNNIINTAIITGMSTIMVKNVSTGMTKMRNAAMSTAIARNAAAVMITITPKAENAAAAMIINMSIMIITIIDTSTEKAAAVDIIMGTVIKRTPMAMTLIITKNLPAARSLSLPAYPRRYTYWRTSAAPTARRRWRGRSARCRRWKRL